MRQEAEKLYILPFDHRASLARLFGFDASRLADKQAAAIADAKRVIYEGFLKALAGGVKKEDAAILVDEEFGAEILHEAAVAGIRRIVPVEKSGQDEFDFKYGDDFAAHLEAFNPEFVKALVRYNADGDTAVNERQAKRLKALSEFCKSRGYPFLLELLVPPTPEQLQSINGDRRMYDRLMRGASMARSIVELRSRGAEPKIWKLEGLEDKGMMQKVIAEAKQGNPGVGVVILGRDEPEEVVRQWIASAAALAEVIGFAVGRTIFEEPIDAWHRGTMTREKAGETIAERYKKLVDLFESMH